MMRNEGRCRGTKARFVDTVFRRGMQSATEQRVARGTAAYRTRGSIRRRTEPVALTLERISREIEFPSCVAGIKACPVDRHTHHV